MRPVPDDRRSRRSPDFHVRRLDAPAVALRRHGERLFPHPQREQSKCMDVDSRSLANDARVIQYTCGTGTNQQWQVIESNGVARFVARHSSKGAAVFGAGTANGTRLVQTTPSLTATSQQFRPTVVGGGGTGGAGGTGGTTANGGSVAKGGTTANGGTTSNGGTTGTGATGAGGTFACNTGTSGYNVTVIKSGSTWTVRRGTHHPPHDRGHARRDAGRGQQPQRRPHDEAKRGGSRLRLDPASSRLSLPSYTVLDVCGTINVTGSGSGDRRRSTPAALRDIEVRYLTLPGTPLYGIFMRNVDNVILGQIDMRLSGGLGVRIDNHGDRSRPVAQHPHRQRVRLGRQHPRRGDLRRRRPHDRHRHGPQRRRVRACCSTTPSTPPSARSTRRTPATGTGYAAFRMANRNGRVGSSYPPTSGSARSAPAAAAGASSASPRAAARSSTGSTSPTPATTRS